LLEAAACGVLFPLSRSADAKAYPERVVRIVSALSAGTAVDDYTRLLAKYLGQKLGQSVIVENKPGANMILASEYVAKASPDGYTLLMASSSPMAANQYLYKQLPYDPDKDFVPVARLSTLALAITVSASSPYKSVADLAAASQKRELNCASAGNGYRLMVGAFNKAAGVRAVDVMYKGLTPVLPDLIGGIVDYSLVDAAAAWPMIQAGKLRALAVLTPKRVSLLPDVPALAETGLKGSGLVEAMGRIVWTGLFAPAGTPAPIVDKLAQFAIEFVHSPEAMTFYANRSAIPNPGNGSDLKENILADRHLWKDMIARIGLTPE